MTFEVDVPYPPSVNHYWRHVGPRTIISRAGRQFRQRVGVILHARGVTPMQGRLAVRVNAYPPDRRRRDLDNILKSLLDSLQHGGAYVDDAQIDLLTIRKCAVEPGGRTHVLIREI